MVTFSWINISHRARYIGRMSEPTAAGAVETDAWATEEFGEANLGNKLRTARLVQMASRAAEKPAGTLPEVFSSQAELEGSYRFVESVHIDHQAVASATHRSTARRSAEEDFVYVPVDGSNITVPWASGTEHFGPVGTSSQRVRGIEVMSAEAVTPQGTPLGLCGQQWWVRPNHKDTKKSSKPRPLHKKETQHWLKCINQSEQAFESEGVTTLRWYQLDAGGDFVTTQLFFENKLYYDYVFRCNAMDINVPILPGLLPATSLKQIKRITSLCQASFPESLAEKLKEAGDDARAGTLVGIDWTADQISDLLSKNVPGVHLYVLNRAKVALAPAVKNCFAR